MQTLVIKSGWVLDEELRLSPSGYSSGGLQARDRIKAGPWQWQPLSEMADVFRGPLHTRFFVRDSERGVPYFTASAVGLIDLPYDSFLSKKRTRVLPALLVDEGWTLLSSAGTIGKTTFVREDISRCCISQDMIRVAPNGSLLPGYIFAYLSTDVAQSIIKLRTYGSVVDRIEPKHIFDLPVPKPEHGLEQEIHGLVYEAASARSRASTLLDRVSSFFDDCAGPMLIGREHSLASSSVPARSLNLRLDAFHHVGWAAEPNFEDGDRLGDLAEIISTARVPRVYAERGTPFLSGIDVFRVRPVPRVLLATHIAREFQADVRAGDLAIQGSGQRYGLLGRAAYIGRRLDGWAASHDLFRLRCADPRVTARIYSFLRSDSGHRTMLRHSYGTSVPHVNPTGIAEVRIPPLPSPLNKKAVQALQLRENADAAEEQAIRMVKLWLTS
jgi:type I restriction enzyme, S subunit